MSVRALTIAALVVASPAHADNALRPVQIPTKARELAERGRALHEAGDYAAAVAAFKEAYVLAPSASLLFNIAQAYRLAGNCDESAWMYRRFLDTDPVGDHRLLAEQHLSSVEKCGSGGLRVSEPPPIDEPKVAEPAPRPKPLAVRKAHVRPKDDTRGRTLQRYGIGAALGGGAVLVGAAVFALDARDAAKTVAETYRLGGNWADVAETDARGRRSAALATGLGVGGGLAVASGVVLFAIGHHYEQAQHVAVTPTSGGARVSLSWGF